jgi:hypothetical protein
MHKVASVVARIYYDYFQIQHKFHLVKLMSVFAFCVNRIFIIYIYCLYTLFNIGI